MLSDPELATAWIAGSVAYSYLYAVSAAQHKRNVKARKSFYGSKRILATMQDTGLTVIKPRSAPVSHCITAGLNCDGFFAGPPTTVSFKLSPPILILSASQDEMFLG